MNGQLERAFGMVDVEFLKEGLDVLKQVFHDWPITPVRSLFKAAVDSVFRQMKRQPWRPILIDLCFPKQGPEVLLWISFRNRGLVG